MFFIIGLNPLESTSHENMSGSLLYVQPWKLSGTYYSAQQISERRICLILNGNDLFVYFFFKYPLLCFVRNKYYDQYFPQIISHSRFVFFFSALKKRLSTEVPLPVKHCQEACRQPAMGGMGQELANRPLALIPLFPTAPTDTLPLPTLSPGHLLSPNTGMLLENSLIC